MATILIVDDQPNNRELLLTLLRYGGHRLLEAADGAAGLSIARIERPDLIITDIVMPVMDGFELAQQVREDPFLSQTQIVFYSSSHVMAEARRLAEACGVAFVLAKPAEPEAILATVEAALNSKHAPKPRPVAQDYYHRQMRLLTNALKRKVEALEKELAECHQVKDQLAALYFVVPDTARTPGQLRPPLLDDHLARAASVTAPAQASISKREAEVLALIAKGHTNHAIAEQLIISQRTVERHRSSIMKKLRLRNRAELLRYAVWLELLGGPRAER